ncbi:MAG: HAD-IA family hydrolase [Chloroflexi bacterium]|nr:HAD-IA family hydrolase [Chloroflexota bacterium]
MQRNAWRAVLFDFDYTLADSSPGVILCANTALDSLGLPPAEPEAIRRTIGMTLADAYRALTGSDDTAAREAFTQAFIACSAKVMAANTRLYESARRMIPRLAAEGYTLGVVSLKYRSRFSGVLEREGIAVYISVLVGGDDVSAHKPAPDSLLLAAEQLAIAPTSCLYVGDNRVDADAAAAAGMAFAGVLTGTHTPAEFIPGTRLFPDLDSLSAWILNDETTR